MKKVIQKLFRRFGFEIHRRPGANALISGPERASLEGSLVQARRAGFVPATVIDVGAAFGSFSRTCHSIFPEAQYILVEPLREYIPSLKRITQEIPRASYEIAVATAQDQVISINVHHDLVGSSLYREVEEGTDVNGVLREVRSITLDRLIIEQKALPPYLIKIDVQGAELDVLTGGLTVLSGAELVVLEVSMFQFFQQGPLFCDVIDYMRSKGFVPYDVLGLQYRPLDRALSQLDIVFVKETGKLRRFHYYATPEQRHEQNRQFRSHFTALLSFERHP
jgi:FkbM family methyltransferase